MKQLQFKLYAHPAALLLLALAPQAGAADCHEMSSSQIVSTVVLRFRDSVCLPGKPLALAETEHAYPLMSNQSYTVRYWQGSYERAASLQDTYRTDVYDSCSGGFLRTIYAPGPAYEGMAQFAIDNPNLHDDVRQSFALVPMTDGEAKAALADRLTACPRASN
jgi:hypothetical protein